MVGYNNTGNDQAFRWTQATGMVGLGDLPGGITNSYAHGVSADGSVVVGYGDRVGRGLNPQPPPTPFPVPRSPFPVPRSLL